MNSFILTHNGKIDTKQLPKYEEKEMIVEPINDRERLIIEAFMSILDSKYVGRDSNFFELGGDSLKTSLIVSCLRKNNFDISPIDVLKYPVVSDM